MFIEASIYDRKRHFERNIGYFCALIYQLKICN